MWHTYNATLDLPDRCCSYRRSQGAPLLRGEPQTDSRSCVCSVAPLSFRTGASDDRRQRRREVRHGRYRRRRSCSPRHWTGPHEAPPRGRLSSPGSARARAYILLRVRLGARLTGTLKGSSAILLRPRHRRFRPSPPPLSLRPSELDCASRSTLGPLGTFR